ncbi:hypothetical protein FGB62_26g32 [Gracilaria domingensis]|nr:hypothetical protein FGB62_26g32 [Gracilaria domingensis]
MFVVRTCPKYYETRLKDALTTYLTKVPSDRILIVGNTPYVISAPDGTRKENRMPMRQIHVHGTDGSDPLNGTVCFDDHAQGITCIEGRALFYAYQRRKAFDWLFVVDDDVYVHRHNLEMTAGMLDPLRRLVYSTPGCAPKVECANAAGGGICRGGGYLLSRQNLERAVLGVGCEEIKKGNELMENADEQTLLSGWMQSWMDIGVSVAHDDGNWFSDITAGCALHIRGCIETRQMAGLHPWPLGASDVIQKLAHEAPLSFHYIDRDGMPGMQALQKLVTGTNRRSTANCDRYADNIV